MTIAKHLTRFRRVSLKKEVVIVYLCCLTKPVRSCKGLTDDSGTRLFPLALHHAGGVGYAPVVIRLGGDFGREVKTVMDAPTAQLTTKPPPKQTYSD